MSVSTLGGVALPIRHYISPQRLAFLSLVPLLFVLPLPASLYEAYVLEHFSRELVLRAAFFYTFNVLVFAAGATAWSAFSAALRRPLQIAERQLFFPLAVATAVQILSILLILGQNPGKIANIVGGAGASAKADHEATGTLTQASTLLQAVLWWYYYHSLQNRVDQPPAARREHMLFYVAISAFAFNAFIKLARFDIIPFSIGMFIIYMHHLTLTSPRPFRAVMKSLLLFSVFVVSVFSVFSVIRGGDDGDAFATVVMTILGYFVAPFVHLGSQLDGQLSLPDSGNGFYSAQFVYNLPLSRLYLSPEMMERSNLLTETFKSEFQAHFKAGLDGRFIWVTAFGYLYADIGNYIYLYMFLLGALSSHIYNLFRQGSSWGIVLYCVIGVSILLWPTGNLLTRPSLNTSVFVAMLLALYDKFSSFRSTDST